MDIICRAPAERASGKQGTQLVYSSWRGMQTARNYAIPSNPQTLAQTTIRSRLTTLAKRWNSLSLGTRSEWITYSVLNPVRSRLGQLVTSTALGMYIGLNQVHQIQAGGASFVDSAPTDSIPGPIINFNGAEATDTFELSIAINHAYTTLTDLWVYCRGIFLDSDAITPAFRATPLIDGVAVGSTKPLAATGSTYAFATANHSTTTGDHWYLYITVVDADGQQSQEIGGMVTLI